MTFYVKRTLVLATQPTARMTTDACDMNWLTQVKVSHTYET